MISVLSPLDGSILLRRYMVTTLNALREPVAVQQLHSALEIYLNDPVADWLSVEPGKGGKGDESGGSFSERESENWQPRRRIRGTIRKLDGVSPVSLMLNDLSENRFVCKHKSRRALEEILKQ